MRVKMLPTPDAFGDSEGGIRRVVEAYRRYAHPDVEYVNADEQEYDILAVHASAADYIPVDKPFVLHLHGLYWTADYPAVPDEFYTNSILIDLIRRANAVTVPSRFVAIPLMRDMRVRPVILRHGIDLERWRQKPGHQGYILWNKNRTGDVCSPKAVTELAKRLPRTPFMSTFKEKGVRDYPNLRVTGVVPHDEMVSLVKNCAIYLATTQETFGIGTVEAMAAGKPVLGFRHGATPEIVQHGVNGYLVDRDDYDALARGIEYIMDNYERLSAAAVATAQKYSWQEVTTDLANLYSWVWGEHINRPHNASVVIPVYNKQDTVVRAIRSAQTQTVSPSKIVVVDNNSTDASLQVVKQYLDENPDERVTVIEETRQGVAWARNAGVGLVNSRYVACLDADDEIAPEFLEHCISALRDDPYVGVAFTRIMLVDGSKESVTDWPSEYHYDRFLQRQNQVPTCALFRRELWERLGGYRQRYAPLGAGSEDADFWLRMGAIGYGGKLVNRPLFRYHTGGSTSQPGYSEQDWLAWHPWVEDRQHPFASLATPRTMSHPVRSYDVPAVSVIIPVVHRHVDYLWDALDSLEAQTMRSWEVVIVIDEDPEDENTGKSRQVIDDFWRIANAYPYVTFAVSGGKGAGNARNVGAKLARAPLLLFLDADDYLHPRALEKMLAAWNANPNHIIYSDAVSPMTVDPQSFPALQRDGRILGQDKRGRHMVLFRSYDYDCEQAQRQPYDDGRGYYLWCNVTSLTPKVWHEAIGGFDVTMESWEDWDYWIRMARRGFCFYRIPEPLLVYRFDTGERRRLANPGETGDDGRQMQDVLLSYMRDKGKDSSAMPCGSCGGRKSTQAPQTPKSAVARSMNQGMPDNVKAGDLVTVRLEDGNVAKHPIAVRGTNYGYRRTGDIFKMLAEHAKLDPRVVITDTEQSVVPPAPVQPPEPEPEPLPEPVAEDGVEVEAEAEAEIEYDTRRIWGISAERAIILASEDIHTVDDFVATSAETIQELLGVTKLIAARMLSSAKQLVG